MEYNDDINSEKLTRRNFLKLGALLAAGSLLTGSLGENPPIPNVLKSLLLSNLREIFPTEEGKEIKAGILGLGDGSVPAKIAADNLFLVREKVFLTPSIHFYPDMWFRDVYFSLDSKYLKSSALADNILTTFEGQQSKSGQIPTTVAIAGDPPYKYSDDESTSLWLIKTARSAREDPSFLTPARKICAAGALGFIRKHEKAGSYVTPPGSRRGIIDAFRFPEHDVVTYLQGIYTASLLAANSLGLELHRGEIKAASGVYRDLMDDGISPLSRNFDKASCVGALCGEYIAIRDFGEQFLTVGEVGNALENAPETDFNNFNGENYFKILSQSAGDLDFFDPENFINLSERGRYQNGGVWLWWDFIAKSVGHFYGLVIVKPDFVSKIQELLRISKYSESIPTGGRFEKMIFPDHPAYVWNTAIA